MNDDKDFESQGVNNPFANISKRENEMEKQKKKNKITIIVAGLVIGLLLIYIFMDMIGDMINKNPVNPQQKERLNEVAVDLENFISDNNLDALDAYGKNELARVAISHICYGVYDCKVVSASEVSSYIKNIFNKDIVLQDVNCEYNDGILYKYDGALDRFVYVDGHPNHVQFNVVPSVVKVNSIKKKNDKYILTLNKLYYDSDISEYVTSDPLGIHKIYEFDDYDMTSESGQVLDVTKLQSDYENDFDKLKNKGTKYRYTFVKDGKKYYLEKYEVIEADDKN